MVMTNRKNRRATEKLAKKGRIVMFSIKAPVFENIVCLSCTPNVYTAMSWTDPDAKEEQSLDHRILSLDKDIIRAIYYPDNLLGIKETPEKFACGLAESVKLWSQRLSPDQQPYFDRVGLHCLDITQTNDDAVEWHWEFNKNNKIALSTETASLIGLSNLEIHSGAQAGEFPIWTGIGNGNATSEYNS
jgi:hypothetical protein